MFCLINRLLHRKVDSENRNEMGHLCSIETASYGFVSVTRQPDIRSSGSSSYRKTGSTSISLEQFAPGCRSVCRLVYRLQNDESLNNKTERSLKIAGSGGCSGDPVGKDQSVIPESEMMPAETEELSEDQQILKLTPLRRSTRIRRQPDRLTYTTMQMDSLDTSRETASETVVRFGDESRGSGRM